MPSPDSEIPYPPVFRDWRHPERRVSTGSDVAGVRVATLLRVEPTGGSTWIEVVLTEDDAALMAASLLLRAGHKKLSRRVLRKLGRRAAGQ